MKTNEIVESVYRKPGVSCKEIMVELGIKSQSSASGMLSALKKSGHLTNKNGKWYRVYDSRNIIKIKKNLKDIDARGDWAEGYISALADYEIITEDEFEHLLQEVI